MSKTCNNYKSEDEKFTSCISVRLNKADRVRLEAFCMLSGTTKSKVIQKALKEYLDKKTEK